MSWVKRVEAVLDVLKGSSIGEIELCEGEVEIILRRSPGNIVAVKAHQSTGVQQVNAPVSHRRSTDMKAPLTGVYYAAPAPTAAPFVNVGDIIQVGQTVALIEAMKVFSEIPSDVAGRVVAIKVQSGDVVKKGDVLLEIEAV